MDEWVTHAQQSSRQLLHAVPLVTTNRRQWALCSLLWCHPWASGKHRTTRNDSHTHTHAHTHTHTYTHVYIHTTHTQSVHNNWVSRLHIMWSFCSSASTFTHDTCYNIVGSLPRHPFFQTQLLTQLTTHPPNTSISTSKDISFTLHHIEPPFPTWGRGYLTLLFCKAVVARCFLFVYWMCACAHVCVWLHSLYCLHTSSRLVLECWGKFMAIVKAIHSSPLDLE